MTGSPTSGSARLDGRNRRLLFVAFSLAPLLFLVCAGEVALRAMGADQPNFRSKLPDELFGVIQADEELFWSPRPGIDNRLPTPFGTMRLRTNSLGLRGGDEFGPKEPDEFRILSLGESSTFGAYVSDDETYSARLEELLNGDADDGSARLEGALNRESSGTHYRVINAGVSAYSSFQSLVYLRERGLALEPDLVLFYHEFNDFLPSSLRSSANTEIGISMTDRELYESGRESFSRWLLANSAIYRFASYQLASARLGEMMQGQSQVEGGEIGLPRVGGSPRVEQFEGDEAVVVQLNDDALPRRVPASERREILEELSALCREHGVELVVIHPAYRRSERHACELTRFGVETDAETFEAFEALHPVGRSSDEMYLDEVHPTPEGHGLLAESLARFLVERGLLPTER